jgi:hypothetical protein
MMDSNMHADFIKIQEVFKYIKSQNKEVSVSPVVYKALENSKVELFGVTIRSSPLFPFETHWDACDVATHQQIQIPSGEWIHGIMMSPIDFNNIEPMPLPIQWYEQDTKSNWLKGRMF